MLAASNARAQRAAGLIPAPEIEPEPASSVVPAHVREGFYLRVATGAVGGAVDRSFDAYAAQGSSSIRGAGFATELSIGGSLRRGFVLAGTIFGAQLPSPRIVDAGSASNVEQTVGFWMLGPSIVVYPNPRHGFHLGAGLGAAWLTSASPGRDARVDGRGGALSLVVGQDWLLGHEWSVGVSGSFIGASLIDRASSDAALTNRLDRVAMGVLMITAVLH